MTDSASRSAGGWVAIVDDDASVRRSLARVLRLEGLATRTFASAEEYLGREPRDEPLCLVLDVVLGPMSGFDLQDRLAAEGRVPPIVFITAASEVTSAQLARASGPHGYLRKPFAMRDLLANVRRHVDAVTEPLAP